MIFYLHTLFGSWSYPYLSNFHLLALAFPIFIFLYFNSECLNESSMFSYKMYYIKLKQLHIVREYYFNIFVSSNIVIIYISMMIEEYILPIIHGISYRATYL